MERNYAGWESLLLQYRPWLISFAFRLTGSLSDAEDIVQETFVACAHIDPASVESPKSWLTKVCSNKGLDCLKRAHKKRETYPGVWLPDAIPHGMTILDSASGGRTPEQTLIDSESLTTSFLLLIERLTPEERVVYLLSEVFDYSFREISGLLEKPEVTCRKIAQRARQSISSGRPKFSPASPQSEKVLATFFEVAKKGDHSALVNLLTEDSELWSDGGGEAPVAWTTVQKDRDKIAGFLAKMLSSPLATAADVKLEMNRVNSRPGLVISRRLASGLWSFDTIMSFEIDSGRIARIYAQRNPVKLRAISPILYPP